MADDDEADDDDAATVPRDSVLHCLSLQCTRNTPTRAHMTHDTPFRSKLAYKISYVLLLLAHISCIHTLAPTFYINRFPDALFSWHSRPLSLLRSPVTSSGPSPEPRAVSLERFKSEVRARDSVGESE